MESLYIVAPWTLSTLKAEVALCGASGIVRPLGACGGGVLWLVWFQKCVKYYVGEDGRVVI